MLLLPVLLPPLMLLMLLLLECAARPVGTAIAESSGYAWRREDRPMAVEHCSSKSKESYCDLDASGCGRVSRATIGQDKLVSLANILTRRTDAAVYLLRIAQVFSTQLSSPTTGS